MKATATILAVSLVLLCISCKKLHGPDAGSPEITFVSFEGIPANHIELDQLHKTITIKVSDLLPEQGLVPTIKTSPGAVITQGLTPEGKLDLTPFCSCYSNHQAKPESLMKVQNENKITGDQLTSTYRVIFSPPKGRIEPIENLPITYSEKIFPELLGSDSLYINIHLPVKNLYQNPYVSAIFFRNMKSGSKAGYNLNGPDCINACEDSRANYMTVGYRTDYGEKLTPGTYEVSIRTSWEEDMIIFPQPFVFNR